MHGKELIDYIADYMENIKKRRVVPAINPGYLQDKIPNEAPLEPESYHRLIDDFEAFIMPGVRRTLKHDKLSTIHAIKHKFFE